MTDRPRRALVGGWAFALSLVPLLWVALAIVLALQAFGGNEVATTFATPIAIGAFAVVPIFSLVAIILAVVALAVSNVVGKIFGVLALLMLAAQVISILLFFAGANDLPGAA
jgi:hypothetical protein